LDGVRTGVAVGSVVAGTEVSGMEADGAVVPGGDGWIRSEEVQLHKRQSKNSVQHRVVIKERCFIDDLLYSNRAGIYTMFNHILPRKYNCVNVADKEAILEKT
jgi:hypothetical protein